MVSLFPLETLRSPSKIQSVVETILALWKYAAKSTSDSIRIENGIGHLAFPLLDPLLERFMAWRFGTDSAIDAKVSFLRFHCISVKSSFYNLFCGINFLVLDSCVFEKQVAPTERREAITTQASLIDDYSSPVLPTGIQHALDFLCMECGKSLLTFQYTLAGREDVRAKEDFRKIVLNMPNLRDLQFICPNLERSPILWKEHLDEVERFVSNRYSLERFRHASLPGFRYLPYLRRNVKLKKVTKLCREISMGSAEHMLLPHLLEHCGREQFAPTMVFEVLSRCRDTIVPLFERDL